MFVLGKLGSFNASAEVHGFLSWPGKLKNFRKVNGDLSRVSDHFFALSKRSWSCNLLEYQNSTTRKRVVDPTKKHWGGSN